MNDHTYRLVECERLPREVKAFEFHYSSRFAMAAVGCACGRGHRILLNLEDQHRLAIEHGWPTVTPSILVADAPCLSHFFITAGQVTWAQQWSQDTVDNVMKNQIQAHVQRDRRPVVQPSFWERFIAWVRTFFGGR